MSGKSADGSGWHDVRRTLLGLLASALGVFPLCDLFSDRGWLIDVWLTMIVVVAPAAVLRRNRSPSAAQIWIGVVLLVPWLTLNFVRSHAVLGLLPGAGAWHDVGHLMHDLHETTSTQVAPVHTTVAVRLTVCAVLGLVAALVDLLAVVGRRGALAGVPLLIVFTVSGAVPREPVSWFWFALSAAGFLILLALDSSDDLQRWGHYVPRSNRASGRRAAGAVSGQRIAAAAIALAVLLPVLVPSDSRNFVSNLFHPHGDSAPAGFGADGNGSGTGGINPFAALRGELNRPKNVNLFTVKISSDSGVGTRGGIEPFYLRTNTLPIYIGTGWRAGPTGAAQSVGSTQFASSPGTEFSPKVVHFSADINISGLRSNPPVFGSPTAVSGVDSSTRWNPQNMLLVGPRVTDDQTYHEQVAQPQPTVADLTAATASDPALSDYLRLPALTNFVRTQTAHVVGRAVTPYDKARAITDYFTDPANGFSYSLATPAGDSGDDLTDFLQNKVGYCQQYAAAMAVMLRASGVPSRVVLGYAHSVPDSAGSFKVTAYDAHAWVEAYFTGIGWVPFDPTPLAGISGGAANDLSWAPHDRTKTATPTSTAGPTPTVSAASRRDEPTTTAPVSAPAAAAGKSLVVPLTLAVIALVIIALLLIPGAVRWRRRRQRLHRVRHGDTDALWAELSDTAIDLGYVWLDARSPRQVAAWLGGPDAKAADGSLRTLTAAVERARYAPSTGDSGASNFSHDLAVVSAGLRARRSGRERWRARLWPASLGWSRMRWVGSWLPGRPGRRR